MSIVRDNLMTRPGYMPYCGSSYCGARQPRSFWNGSQFECSACGWKSQFPDEFIEAYKAKWSKKDDSLADIEAYFKHR